jgi:hypothetical protein
VEQRLGHAVKSSVVAKDESDAPVFTGRHGVAGGVSALAEFVRQTFDALSGLSSVTLQPSPLDTQNVADGLATAADSLGNFWHREEQA